MKTKISIKNIRFLTLCLIIIFSSSPVKALPTFAEKSKASGGLALINCIYDRLMTTQDGRQDATNQMMENMGVDPVLAQDTSVKRAARIITNNLDSNCSLKSYDAFLKDPANKKPREYVNYILSN
jgi:hypothetical protein